MRPRTDTSVSVTRTTIAAVIQAVVPDEGTCEHCVQRVMHRSSHHTQKTDATAASLTPLDQRGWPTWKTGRCPVTGKGRCSAARTARLRRWLRRQTDKPAAKTLRVKIRTVIYGITNARKLPDELDQSRLGPGRRRPIERFTGADIKVSVAIAESATQRWQQMRTRMGIEAVLRQGKTYRTTRKQLTPWSED